MPAPEPASPGPALGSEVISPSRTAHQPSRAGIPRPCTTKGIKQPNPDCMPPPAQHLASTLTSPPQAQHLSQHPARTRIHPGTCAHPMPAPEPASPGPAPPKEQSNQTRTVSPPGSAPSPGRLFLQISHYTQTNVSGRSRVRLPGLVIFGIHSR